MKVGILTQPLHNNYGGLLQNYALQVVLNEMGHNVFTINIVKNNNKLHRKILSLGKRIILNLVGKKMAYRIYPTKKESKIISRHTKAFVKDNIKTTNEFTRKITPNLIKKYAFEAYIVGSDQVWRPRYSPQMPTYFLDFVANDSSIKKVAYAASFGVSNLEFSLEKTREFAKLLKVFDAVSVREDSAIKLCKEYFDIDAIQLIDPTMMLNKSFYSSIAYKRNLRKSAGNLFTYILDKSGEKSKIINTIAAMHNLTPFTVMPKKIFSDPGKKNIQNCIFPPVEQWIKGFIDAEFVITDSFHGTVFSILFNKPFIAIANASRGITRFESLLKLFELEEKLITNFSEIDLNKLATKDAFDWDKVNNVLEKEQKKAKQFLEKNLK